MSTRGENRTQQCGRREAQARFRLATLYLEMAEMVLSSEDATHATVATGNAVLAAIAASDAICCALAGQRYRGQDHRQAVALLQRITADRTLAAELRDVLDAKDAGHYGLANIPITRAKSALRKARHLVEAAKLKV